MTKNQQKARQSDVIHVIDALKEQLHCTIDELWQAKAYIRELESRLEKQVIPDPGQVKNTEGANE